MKSTTRRRTTIYRSERAHGYTKIDRLTLEDSGLSWAARGVLTYLLAKPDDWEVSVSDLRRQGNLGKDGLYALIDELLAHGYLVRERERVAGGRFGRLVYRVFERPGADEPSGVVP